MEFNAPTMNLIVILPAIIVGGWGVLMMIADMLLPEENESWPGIFAIVGLMLAAASNFYLLRQNLDGFSATAFLPADGGPAMMIADGYVSYLNLIFLISAVIATAIAMSYLGRAGIEEKVEYYILMLFATSGMMLMGAANDLILIFIALELLSIPLYVMCGIARPRETSEESAMKYFLLGAFASGFLVFGIALLYGATGSTALPTIAENFMAGGVLSLAGFGLILVGFAFKVGAVPFHMWTPDVYEGAPTAVTAFMSIGAKVGGFAALIRILIDAVPGEAGDTWAPVIAVIAAVTMILGNVVAIEQTNVKRILGYSSIAHGGYILMAVAAIPYSGNAVSSILTYMLTYTFTNLGAFAVIIMLEKANNEGLDLDSYRGLGKNNIGMALVLTYFLMSLIGMPLTGGFIGKFVVFQSVVEANMIWLAIVGVLTSAVSAYYYLRMIYYMFMYEGAAQTQSHTGLSFAAALCLMATIAIALVPGIWIDLARSAVETTSMVIAGG